MGSHVIRGGARLLAATVLAAAATAAFPVEGMARVGVTSGADGDPLGKPPHANERILRIGIDVQANELVTTNANDRAHLVFLDGSSLTVGPNAQLTIDRFVFDPNTKTGELAINASKGVLRLVGGKISKNTPITITTPASTIGIRGGITILDVKPSQTDSTFVFGKDMTVKGAGQTQVATRPGSMIVTNLGRPPGMPTLLAQGALNAQLAALEGRRTPQGGRWRRQRTQRRSGRAELWVFERQLQPVGTHHRARRAGQFRFRPRTQQPQSKRHDPDGVE